MENMNPLLHLIVNIRLSLERGEPVRMALKNYLNVHHTDLTPGLGEWLLGIEQSRILEKTPKAWNTPFRQATLLIFSKGLRGEPILPTLTAMESEVYQACEEALEQKTATLPLQCLFPLLLLQFPALLMLILGPILGQLVSGL